jgi:hypothetical protein
VEQTANEFILMITVNAMMKLDQKLVHIGGTSHIGAEPGWGKQQEYCQGQERRHEAIIQDRSWISWMMAVTHNL